MSEEQCTFECVSKNGEMVHNLYGWSHYICVKLLLKVNISINSQCVILAYHNGHGHSWSGRYFQTQEKLVQQFNGFY